MIDFSKIKSKKEVGKCFDYAILPKQTTEQTIRDCCKEAIKYNCKAFCFSSSYWTPIVAEELKERISWLGQRLDSHLASRRVQ